MKIILCLDYSSFTEQVLGTVKTFIDSLNNAEITVLHIIDEQLFFATTGYEVTLGETLENESQELKELCIEYLGEEINFQEECGIPKLKVEEVLAEAEFDLLIAGSHSRHGLAGRLLGSFAEHLVRISNKPVLIIP